MMRATLLLFTLACTGGTRASLGDDDDTSPQSTDGLVGDTGIETLTGPAEAARESLFSDDELPVFELTMTNQAIRRGGFFNRVYQVATVTVAGAGTDAVRAVCSAPATAFRQGMPLVVDYGDCSDAPEYCSPFTTPQDPIAWLEPGSFLGDAVVGSFALEPFITPAPVVVDEGAAAVLDELTGR